MPKGHPIPQSVCDRARRLAEVHGQHTVAQIIGTSPSVVWQMARRGWKAATPGHPIRPMPSDFPIQVNHMGYTELCAHYRTGTSVIRRWKRELRDKQSRPSDG